MKILKNIFGSKPKQSTKYEPNTLAEMNGSPDLRLATAKEKEVDIPLPKAEEVKKISRSSAKPSSQKSTASSSKNASSKKSTPSAPKATTQKQVSSTNKSTQKKPSASTDVAEKETTVKKTSETKKTTSTATKKPEVKAKATTSKIEKKPVAEAKKEVKVASAAKNSTTAKKETTKEVKKAATSTEAKKPTATKVKTPNQPEKKETKKTSAAKTDPQKDAETVTESKTTRSGKFEIKKSKDGRFVFNLYASNNVIVATSQIYSSSTSAVNGIKSVVANAASAQIEDQSLKKVTPVPFPKWEIYQDKGEQYRFRLCASNGSCIVHSQGYTSKANCKKGIESIIKFASDAEITKVYLDKKDK